jgi:hypothetical protein
MTRWFLSRGSLATKLVPVVSTAHLVVRELIGTMPSPYVGRHKNLPEVRVAQWHAQLELLFVAPAGWAQYPSHSNLQSTAQSSLRATTETTTKPSRRWHPPKVTSTTSLQLEHLVPLDKISQYNRTRITHSQSDRTLASTSKLEGSQALLHKPHRHEGAQPPAQG